MPSRSPSPPRGGRGGDLDEPSMASRFQFPTSAQPSYASVVRRGLATVSQTHHQEESCLDSEFELDHRQEESCLDSEFELDSPPRLTIMNIPDEPHTPTSPPGSPPPPIDVDLSRFPTFGSDTEDDTEDDPYFKSLVDNFIIAAKDVCKTSKDNIDKKAGSRRQSDRYAESVLKHYNNDKNNKVKYDLISAITSCAIFDMKGFFGHVNFIAKGNQQDSKEELFFAEVHLDHGNYVPTIVLSLEGMKKVGGLCESKYDSFNGVGFPFDAQHCYACGGRLKHPKNGALYEAGHIAVSDYYHG